tara:strand:+ start:1202 stop:2263 length:1062 start_codon:yes stop_codon:yes gene_type:complete
MKVLILGSNSRMHCGWTTMTKGISEGFNFNNVRNFILEGINRNNRNFNFNNPFYLSYHIRTNLFSLFLDVLRIFFISIIYRPSHILIIPELLCLPTYIVSKLLNIKYSIYSAGTYSSFILSQRGYFLKKSFLNAKNIFPMSEYTKNRIIEKCNHKRIFVVYAGYNHNQYYKRDIEKEKYSIIYVGNLKKRKGFKVLCDSVISLPISIRKNIFIRLVGSFNKKEFSKYSKILKNKDISFQIFKDISDEQLSILFNKSEINILPSITEENYYEGFGIIHSEAIASNCMTIGSLNSGNESAISINNGYLINNKIDINQELTNLLKNIFNSSKICVPSGQKPLKWSKVVNKMILKIK